LEFLWGDWRESYTKILRLLNDISHFNLGTRCIVDTCDQWLPNKKDRYYLVLKGVFWCFPQCVAGFGHCRPIISGDATFLTWKYICILVVVAGMTVENQLLPLAFVFVEGENNESWSWFLGFVRKEVLGPARSICMILDCHYGLLNGVKEHIEGYPPLIHMWYSHHFATNNWKK
jgi:hypothetical protein